MGIFMTTRRSNPQRGVADTDAHTYPEPITQADRVIIEMRKFITAAVLLNARIAEKLGLTMTDVQVISVLQLYGPSNSEPSRRCNRAEQRRRHRRARPARKGQLHPAAAEPRRPSQSVDRASAVRPGAARQVLRGRECSGAQGASEVAGA